MPQAMQGPELVAASPGHMGVKKESTIKPQPQPPPPASSPPPEVVPPPPDLHTDNPTAMAMAAQNALVAPGVLVNQGVQQMLAGVDGGKGKNKYQPKKCDHGR